jgi:hypothetical protein
MVTWPTSLPVEPIPDSISETPPKLSVRTEMDAGPAKVRRRFSSGVRLFEVAYMFSPAEMDIWELFYEETIFDGTMSFSYPHPRKWGTMINVRLTDTPQYKHKGAGYYDVVMKLEQIPTIV